MDRSSSRRPSLIAKLAVACALASSACVDTAPMSTPADTRIESNGGRYGVTIDGTSVPIHRGTNDLTLRVETSANTPGAITTVRAWMPAHGHETYPVEIVAVAPGVFTARDVTLTMPGEWAFDVALAPSDSAPVDDRITLWASVE